MTMSYCCDIHELRVMYVARHGAGRQHPYVKCNSTYEDMMMGEETSSPVVTETMQTQRRVSNCKKSLENWLGRAVVEDSGR